MGNVSMMCNSLSAKAHFWRAFALVGALFAVPAHAMEELSDSALAENAGQGLLVADKIEGMTDSRHTFYRMALNAELGINSSIDKLQLGCGGFNDAVVANACDIDIDYVTLMGRGAGQPGAAGAGTPADSQFKLTRPYIEIAVKNDNDPTRREIIGFKLGAQTADGFMGLGRYTAPGSPGASPSCTNDPSGKGAFYCHQGINRLSGYMKNYMTGEAYGCFALTGCDPTETPRDQQRRVATFKGELVMWGTRLNRIQVTLAAKTDPAATLGLELPSDSFSNQSLRFIHGQSINGTDAEFLADDFFQSFQREPVRWPTYNKTEKYSNTANPGWWMNIPVARLDGLKAYNVAASLGSLSGIALDDPDIGQRPPDNCYGGLRFC